MPTPMIVTRQKDVGYEVKDRYPQLHAPHVAFAASGRFASGACLHLMA
jgi:hypothetical protein